MNAAKLSIGQPHDVLFRPSGSCCHLPVVLFISLSENIFKQRNIGECKYTPYTLGFYAPALMCTQNHRVIVGHAL